ncbi:hypothetical protein DM01DRAFT_1380309 [Hesseltinella vesiculosa]|uniref:GAR domain-containing protein n=1 Tax=Hesseltinella vesiculosa TaxID=101127 RepID=A0A1X2GTQ0_9FUNG|nr:hypothetical protein DM01DRAFT_1380309 [Hesseltinella vesiculosa]
MTLDDQHETFWQPFQEQQDDMLDTPSQPLVDPTWSDATTTIGKTTTMTATIQHYRLTKTVTHSTPPPPAATETTTAEPPFLPPPSDNTLFETRTNWLIEQMAALHSQLGQLLPTRSHYHQVPPSQSDHSSSSCSSSLVSLPLDWELKSTDGSTSSTHVLLHPLQAAHEDMALYESNWLTMQSRMTQVADTVTLLHQQCPWWDPSTFSPSSSLTLLQQDQQQQVARLSQLGQTYDALNHRMIQAENQFKAFQQGFHFGQACLAIRLDLDAIQANMTQQRSNQHQTIVQAWQQKMSLTTESLQHLRLDYPHYFSPGPTDDSLAVVTTPTQDPAEDMDAYVQRWQQVFDKNALVQSWVEEVRVWFAEADRIRLWIDERRLQLEALSLPDPIDQQWDQEAIQAALHQWQQDHHVLEHDMETFNQQDMARLRSHVKALTGGKDLSPADTTTIEITLTTLTTLDKVMHALRDKTHRLDLLTKRAAWEDQCASTLAWLHTTEHEVDAFLTLARWHQPDGQDSQADNDETHGKAYWIDHLLTLEHKLSEYDKTGFSSLIQLFEDLYDSAQVDLPSHFEQRQSNCEEFFEDLFKRMSFVRSVVEQRLAVMDFLALVDKAQEDAHLLHTELDQVCDFIIKDDVHHDPAAGPPPNPPLSLPSSSLDDHDEQQEQDIWAEKIQATQEHIVALASTQRIPYPLATLVVDEEANNDANQHVRQWIGHYRTQLVHLGESVDKDWQNVKHRWVLRQRMQEMMNHADICKQWALEQDQQLVTMEQQRLALGNTASLDQFQAWERLVTNMKAQLHTKRTTGADHFSADHVLALAEAVHAWVPQDKDKPPSTQRLHNAVEAMHDSYTDLQQHLSQQELALLTLSQQLEQGRNLDDMRRDLWQWVHRMRTAFPGIKHTCGFITGESLDQDEDRLDTLQTTLAQWQTQLKDQTPLYLEFVHHLGRHQSSTPPEDQSLQDEWALLTQELDDLATFQENVTQWYNRQRRLSQVQMALDQLLAPTALHTEADQDDPEFDAACLTIGRAQLDMLEDIYRSMEQDQAHSPPTASKFKSRLTRAPLLARDPLQTANYACAKERYQSLKEYAQEIVAAANERSNRRQQQQDAWRDYQGQVDALVEAIQQDRQRLTQALQLQQSSAMDLAIASNVDGLQALLQDTLEHQQAQQDHGRIDRWSQWEHLRKLTPPATPSSSFTRYHQDQSAEEADAVTDLTCQQQWTDDQCENDHRRMRTALQDLDQTMVYAKQQMQSVRHLYVHAKAARDIDTWLKQCDQALTNLMADVGLSDDAEVRVVIGSCQAKLDAMQQSLRSFDRIQDKALDMVQLWQDAPFPTTDVDHHAAWRQAMGTTHQQLTQKVGGMHARLDQIRLALDQHGQQTDAARRMKDLLRLVGSFRERVAAIRVPVHDEVDDSDDLDDQQTIDGSQKQARKVDDDVDDDLDDDDDNEDDVDDNALSAWLVTCPLPLLPTDTALDGAQQALDQVEQDIESQLMPLRHQVDQSLVSHPNLTDQRNTVAQAMGQLAQAIEDKRYWLARARHLSHVMTILDEWDVLLVALSDIVDQARRKAASVTIASQQSSPSLRRADLQAALIELETRYKYYEPNLVDLIKEAAPFVGDGDADAIVPADQHATDDACRDVTKQAADACDIRLDAFYDQLIKRWYYLQHQVQVQRQALISKMPVLSSSPSSVVVRQMEHYQQRRRTMSPGPASAQTNTTNKPTTTPRPRRATYVPMSDYNRQYDEAQRPHTSMSMFRSQRKSMSPMARRSYTPSATPTLGASPRLMTAERALKRTSWRSLYNDPATRPNKKYVADPKNDLDVAVGNIVNDSPYGVPVKMVPGEVGRYWFGDKNPKLAYCRILRSRMVMVRVGGGWVELSQFLRDHALIEDVGHGSLHSAAPAASHKQALSLSTSPPAESQTNGKKRHSHPPALLLATPSKTDGSLQASNSTETFTSPSYFRLHGPGQPAIPGPPPSPGIKEGNKFLVTDHAGNRVQVTMTKARSKQTSSPHVKIPWR